MYFQSNILFTELRFEFGAQIPQLVVPLQVALMTKKVSSIPL